MRPKTTASLAGDMIALMQDLLSWQEHIERGLRNFDGAYSFDDVVASVLRQERHFYDFGDCCFIMQVDKYPHAKAYHCFLACGSFEGMLREEATLAEIGRNLGCKVFSISGRPGWARRLKAHGWKHLTTTMAKEL